MIILLLTMIDAGNALELLKGPYLQDVTQTGITIVWETDIVASTEILYTEQALPHLERHVRQPAFTKIHEIRLEELQPEMAYRYRVISENLGGQRVESPAYIFRTASHLDTPFRFVVWGDSRTDHKKARQVAELIARQKPDFVVSVGDVVSDGNTYSDWGTQYFDPIKHFASTTPSYVAAGNHEEDAHWFDDFLAQPGNEHWFAFSYGNSRFIVLDTNRPYEKGSQQYEWFLAELQSRESQQASFRFTFFHHPPYSELSYPGDANVRAFLVPLSETYGVDIVFAGHTHDYERGRKQLGVGRDIYYIITGGGGSPLKTKEAKDWDFIQLHRPIHHCVVIDVEGDTLTLQALALNAEVIDAFTKVSLPRIPIPAQLSGRLSTTWGAIKVSTLAVN